MTGETLPLDQILSLLLVVLGLLIAGGFAFWWTLNYSFGLVRSGQSWFRQSQVWRNSSNWRRGWRTHFPRSHAFVANRLNTGRFSGLPLTLFYFAALYLALLFGGLTEELMEAKGLEVVDREIMDMLAPFRAPELVPAAIWLTDLGGMPALTLVALVATGFMWTHGPRRYIAPVWLTVMGSQITTWGGKFLINRARPDFILDVTAYSPSFPSGHATGAAAVLGIVTYVIARDMPDYRWRFAVAYFSVIVIVLIGFSRIFLNVHYPSDVAAGFLVGAFWVLAGIALAEMSRAKMEAPSS